MKRNTFWNLAAGTAVLWMTTAATAPATAQPRGERLAPVYEPELRPEPVRPHARLRVDVWTDVGDGGTARPGESVRVFFRTNRSAFVSVYSIDTLGRKTRLFPRHPREDGWVRGGRTVSLGDRYDAYRLVVTGPRGTERIVAMASARPLRDGYLHRSGWDEGGCGLHGDDCGGIGCGVAAGVYGTAPVAPRVRYEPRPELRVTPVPRRVARDETWFRVVGRWKRHRGHGY